MLKTIILGALAMVVAIGAVIYLILKMKAEVEAELLAKIDNGICPKCDGELFEIGEDKYKCTECYSAFGTDHVAEYRNE